MYSIRMRAAQGGPHEHGGEHISGAERLVDETDLAQIAHDLVARALAHGRGKPDFVNVVIDAVDDATVQVVPPLQPTATSAKILSDARIQAQRLLQRQGISVRACTEAERWLSCNAQSSGAVFLDWQTGQRYGDTVRVSRLAWQTANWQAWAQQHPNLATTRIQEALALATKVQASAVLAEYCWSDDPDYVTGYVTDSEHYYRLAPLKVAGSRTGGRVFFVTSDTDLAAVRQFLTKVPVVIGASHVVGR